MLAAQTWCVPVAELENRPYCCKIAAHKFGEERGVCPLQNYLKLEHGYRCTIAAHEATDPADRFHRSPGMEGPTRLLSNVSASRGIYLYGNKQVDNPNHLHSG